jgi:hypothetical protein
MEKPQRLKSDIELKVSDDPVSEHVGAEQVGGEQVGSGQVGNGQVGGEQGGSGKTTPNSASSSDQAIENSSVQKQIEAISRAATKKSDEQAFMRAYKSRQRRVRATFFVVAFLLLQGFSIGLNSIYKNTDVGRRAVDGVSTTLILALLGEKDFAHFQMSNFDTLNKVDGNLTKERGQIIANSISEQEKSGKLAIFSRLGLESMLMKHPVNRQTGLQYGDRLIEAYPSLPSNYCWRAKVDYDNGNFIESSKEYAQFANLLEKSPTNVGQAWISQLPRAIWSCLNSGQAAEAQKFVDLYEKYGGLKDDVGLLRSQLLVSSCEELDLPELMKSEFWNPTLDKKVEQKLEQAKRIAEKVDYTETGADVIGTYKHGVLFDISVLSKDHAFALKYIEEYGSWESYSAPLQARLAFSENDPEAALRALSGMNLVDADVAFLKASALQELHRTKLAQEAIDASLHDQKYYWTMKDQTNQVRLVQARLFLDNGKYAEALKECDELAENNPNLLGPHLIRLQIFKLLKDQANEATERAKITTLLGNFLSSKDSRND